MYLDIYLPITPQPKLRPRMGPRGAYTPAKTKKAEQDLRILLNHELPYGFKMSEGEALSLDLTFYISTPESCKRDYPTVRPDLDNYIKLVMDALNGLVWKDDAQVCSITAHKTYSKTEPGINIVISSMS